GDTGRQRGPAKPGDLHHDLPELIFSLPRFVRPIAPMAGARVSHSPIVTTLEVTSPNGRMPTSEAVIPAKIMSSHALTNNSGPAANSLKNASMPNLRLVRQLDRAVSP